MLNLIVEHKTTSEDIAPGSDYWKRLRLDAQVSNYFVGAAAGGYPADECLYDVIRKPALRPCAVPEVDADGVKIVLDASGVRVRTKDGRKWRETASAADGYVLQTRPETPEEYRARLRADIAEQPDRYYARGTVVRLEEDARDAAQDAWQTARELREAELAQRFPRNPDACVRYGRTCDYFAVCTRETTLSDGTRYRRKDRPHVELADPLADNKARLPLVTTSSMRTFKRCAREYQHTYMLGYIAVETADALRFGTLFHAGLEVWWKTVDLDAATAAMVGAVDEYEQVRAEEMLRGYHFRWKDEPLDVLAVELEFRAPLVNPETGATSRTYELGGKIDAIARATRRGEEAAE